jgi:hypothetical protein
MDAQDTSPDAAAYGRYFGGESMFRLTLPDGNTVGAAVGDLRVLQGAVETNVYVAFTFTWPLPGRYTFQLIYKSSDEAVSAANTIEIPFTLGASPSP